MPHCVSDVNGCSSLVFIYKCNYFPNDFDIYAFLTAFTVESYTDS